MDLLLRLLERRVWGTVVALAALVVAGEHLGPLALERWDAWRHPPPTGESPLAADLLADNERRESAKLRGLHRTVSREIAAARAKGFAVDRLQRAADAALSLDNADYRPAAIERLNRLRLAIPTRAAPVRPADLDLDASDAQDEPRSRRRRRR